MMIAELANLLDDFPGPANQMQCFTHILNLIVKSVIRQFDLPKSKGDKILDNTAKKLLSLAGNIEFEEDELARRDGKEGDEDEDKHQETATLLWLSLDALAVLEHPKASWDVLGGLRMSQDS
jgi:hypothetical protein